MCVLDIKYMGSIALYILYTCVYRAWRVFHELNRWFTECSCSGEDLLDTEFFTVLKKILTLVGKKTPEPKTVPFQNIYFKAVSLLEEALETSDAYQCLTTRQQCAPHTQFAMTRIASIFWGGWCTLCVNWVALLMEIAGQMNKGKMRKLSLVLLTQQWSRDCQELWQFRWWLMPWLMEKLCTVLAFFCSIELNCRAGWALLPKTNGTNRMKYSQKERLREKERYI